MRNKYIIFTALLLVSVIMTGCKKSNSADNSESDIISAAESSEIESAITFDDDTSAESETATVTEDSGATTSATVDGDAILSDSESEETIRDSEDENEFSFDDIDNLDFYFSSGAGGWGTELRIENDGYFRGSYHDSDMGDIGNGYDEGTVYYCNYSGHFTAPVKVDDYTYSTTISDIKYADPGYEMIAGNVRYITSDPYGITGGKTFYIHLPNTPVSSLSEELQIWLYLQPVSENDTINMYAFENVEEEEAFSSYERPLPKDDAQSQLDIYRNSFNEIDNYIATNEFMSQLDYNITTKLQYDNCDYLMNYLWDLIKYNTDKDTFAKILEEQRAWLKYRDEQIEKDGSEFEGGSMQPMIMNSTGASLTLKRCEELVKYIK